MTLLQFKQELKHLVGLGKALQQRSVQRIEVRNLRATRTYPEHCQTINACIFSVLKSYMPIITDADIKEIFPMISKILNVVSTRAMGLFSQYRNDLGLTDAQKLMIKDKKLLYVDENQYESNKKKDIAREKKKHNNNLTFKESTVMEIVKLGMKPDATVFEKIAALATEGSRGQEIINHNVSKFKPVDGKPMEIKMIGHAKAKGMKNTLSSLKSIIVKPLIYMDSNTFLSKLKEIRDEINVPVMKITDDASLRKRVNNNAVLTNKYVGPAGEIVKGYFPEYHSVRGQAGLHQLRSKYLASAFQRHHSPNETILAYGQRILSHESINTVQSYMGSEVEDEGDISVEIREGELVEIRKKLLYNERVTTQLKESLASLDKKFTNTFNNLAPLSRRILPGDNPPSKKRQKTEDVEPDKIMMINREGNQILVTRFPKSGKNVTDEFKKTKVEDGVKRLREANVIVSFRSLQALCISRAYIKLYW
jgi:hypothetical protein